MTITDRDRKIIMVLIPLAIAAAYWFLLLQPKRDEAAKIKDQLTTAQSQRDDATSRASQLSAAKRSFGTDYATVIRLGKSIPAGVDMPSLLVQLDRAARGTGINFQDVTTGDRTAAAAPAGAPGTPAPPAGSGNPAAQGAPAAQSDPGKAAQAASNAANQSNNASAQSGVPANSQGAPAAGGASAASVPGLETVPLDFKFSGSFFDLADFFHRMKRFVRVANDRIVIRGRLLTINSFSFDSSESFPQLVATVHATVYLAPKAEGVSAGATPQGPPQPASGAPHTASSSAAPPTPVATVTTR